MIKKSGVIETMSRDGKRFKLEGGEEWYSAFSASQVPKGTDRGMFVKFSYVETNKSGTIYCNIKGNVTVEEAPATVSGGSGPAAPRAVAAGAKTFPVGPLHPDRSIIRQNSLGHAVEAIYHTSWDDYSTIEEYADRIIEMARKFEAYSAGDLDMAVAMEALEEMTASEKSR